MTNAEKVTENRLRRLATRRGYILTKSRVRDPKAKGFGVWTVAPENLPLAKKPFTLAEVEEFFK
jgi:hypothetical protein